MKPVVILFFMLLILSSGLTSCSKDMQEPPLQAGESQIPGGPDHDDSNNSHTVSRKFRIIIGTVSFDGNLADNAASAAFKTIFPVTIHMSDLNGNEKYFYLSDGLPTAATRPGTIRAGDLMLYGNSCVVLFYETFPTSYSYTRLGSVDNPSALKAAVGRGNVQVTFELQ